MHARSPSRPDRPVRRLLAIALACGAAGFGGCGEEETGGPDVMVSILPQAWFVEQIAGPELSVAVLVGPGQSPATFDPSPRQIADLLGAGIYVRAGVPFERSLLPRIERMPGRPRIVTPPSIAQQEATSRTSEAGSADDGHGHGHGHDHGGIDPHTWLDPQSARAQAAVLTDALCDLRPDAADSFRVRARALDGRLRALETELRETLAPYRGESFFVFHPAYGHFAAAFGLRQVAIEIDGHEPGPRHLARVVEAARDAGVRAIVVQPQFSQEVARKIAAEIGAGVVALDPLARTYDENLRFLATSLAAEFEARRTGGGPE